MKKVDQLSEELLEILNIDSSNLDIIQCYLKKAYDSNCNIIKSIKRAKQRAEEKNWGYTYWFFDIHETIIVPNYKVGEIPTEFYPLAKETLQMINKRSDIVMCLYTCSWPEEIKKYDKFFKENGIEFDYLYAKNPDVENNALGYYDYKPYFNVLFEDKAGFSPEDWEKVKEYLELNPDKNLEIEFEL